MGIDFKNLGAKVADFAPMLGGILGGPGGALAGKAIDAIADAFGLKGEEVTLSKIDELVKDPQSIIKLKEIESTLIISLEQIAQKDRESARAREVKIVETTKTKDVNLYILAWVVVGGFFGLVGTLSFITIPQVNVGPVNQLYGVLGTGFGLVLGYFFGSSKGSSDKNKFLNGDNKES